MSLKPRSCVCCQSQDFLPHLSILLRCQNCGHVMANLDLDSFNAKGIYKLDYFQDGEYLDYLKDRACFEKNFQKRLNSVRKFHSRGNLLEIGSAGGFFLHMAHQYFSTRGYEICEEMAQYARREFALDIRSKDFLVDEVMQGSQDVVVLWDCIEHLPNPDDFFKKIHAVLRTKGVVALTTGDISSLMARIQGRHWRLIHPPTHVHYFTRQSMEVFLGNHGFEVLEISYPGYSRSLRQMLYGVLSKYPSLWEPIDSSFWGGVSIYLNLFDIMQVIARKT